MKNKKISILCLCVITALCSVFIVGCSFDFGKKENPPETEVGKNSDVLEYSLLSNDTYAVFLKEGEYVEEIVIPSVYEGKPVSKIGNTAFKNYEILESITIPGSVGAIGDSAFEGCLSLKNIEMEAIDITMGRDAFKDCLIEKIKAPYSVIKSLKQEQLKEIEITGTDIIEEGAFSNYHNLNKIIVGNDNDYYKTIDGNLYSKDGTILLAYAIGKSDTEFSIPEGVSKIGNKAFLECSVLTKITLSKGVVEIGKYAFSNCSATLIFNYNGTKEEFRNVFIDEGNNIYGGIVLYSVFCSDGETVLQNYINPLASIEKMNSEEITELFESLDDENSPVRAVINDVVAEMDLGIDLSEVKLADEAETIIAIMDMVQIDEKTGEIIGIELSEEKIPDLVDTFAESQLVLMVAENAEGVLSDLDEVTVNDIQNQLQNKVIGGDLSREDYETIMKLFTK